VDSIFFRTRFPSLPKSPDPVLKGGQTDSYATTKAFAPLHNHPATAEAEESSPLESLRDNASSGPTTVFERLSILFAVVVDLSVAARARLHLVCGAFD
jgi:hypothetical protein